MYRKAAERANGAKRVDIEAAIAATEVGNPDLFLDRTGGYRDADRLGDENGLKALFYEKAL